MAFTRAGLCWAAAASLMIGAAFTWPVSAQEQTAATAPAVDSQAPEPLFEDELEELLAPIALYPAELVAVICATVNQHGIVYQTDLGPSTEAIVKYIERFNPDEGWSVVDD